MSPDEDDPQIYPAGGRIYLPRRRVSPARLPKQGLVEHRPDETIQHIPRMNKPCRFLRVDFLPGTDRSFTSLARVHAGEHLSTLRPAGAIDDDLREKIAAVWSRRADRYSEERAALTDDAGRVIPRAKIEMYQVGG